MVFHFKFFNFHLVFLF